MVGETARVRGGLYDIGVGVPDAADGIAHWQRFGYREGKRGGLDATAAEALYGVKSELNSVRLFHQDSDRGLIRLMVWDRPTGPGLNMAPLRTMGTRWSVHKTDDMITCLNHAEMQEVLGGPIYKLGPHMNPHIPDADHPEPRPFSEPIACVRDLIMFLPYYQHVAMTRYNFDMPLYGRVNPDCLFKTSEVCHAAIVTKGDDMSVYDFYEDVFGLKRWGQREIDHETSWMATTMHALEPGDLLRFVNFDDTESDDVVSRHRSGRLRCFQMPAGISDPDRSADARPGNLGYSLYTYRVADIEAMHRKVRHSAAGAISDIIPDEFGQPAFSFTAPDGYFWTLFEA